MNVSTIISMIEADPTITDDVSSFLNRMNDKNIKQVKTVITTKDDQVIFVSIADLNGGKATAQDVQAAVDAIGAKPLYDETQVRVDNVVAAIQLGKAKTSTDIINTFSEDITNDS